MPELSVHGGDIYRNDVALDFSVNTNYLGMPPKVREALAAAVSDSSRYPDMQCETLAKAVSGFLKEQDGAVLTRQQMLFGNGASELLLAAAHALRPGTVLLPVPSFGGYRLAAQAAAADIVPVLLRREDGFAVRADELIPHLKEADLLILANPNNPTGRRIAPDELAELLTACGKAGTAVLLDESFIDFCGAGCSLVSQLGQYPHLLIVRSFTKIFSIPGVRLGLLLGGGELVSRVRAQIPEWNVSVFAQAAGIACCEETDFCRRTAEGLAPLRRELASGLERLGLEVFPSDANYLLFRDPSWPSRDLYRALLRRRILIRDCGSFEGLEGRGFFRVAVRTQEENRILLRELHLAAGS